MKRFFAIAASSLLLFGCSSVTTNTDSEIEQARILIEKVCDGENSLTWQERANYAAQANALDNRWERLSDAANFVAGEAEIEKLRKSIDNSLNYGTAYLEVLYQSRLSYTKFVAECSILDESKK